MCCAVQEAFGADSMILALALSQHSRLANAALDRDFRLGEALLKQHVRMLEAVNPGGEVSATCLPCHAWVQRALPCCAPVLKLHSSLQDGEGTSGGMGWSRV